LSSATHVNNTALSLALLDKQSWNGSDDIQNYQSYFENNLRLDPWIQTCTQYKDSQGDFKFSTEPSLCAPLKYSLKQSLVCLELEQLSVASRGFPGLAGNSNALTNTSQDVGLCVWEFHRLQHCSSRRSSDSLILTEPANWQVIGNIYHLM